MCFKTLPRSNNFFFNLQFTKMKQTLLLNPTSELLGLVNTNAINKFIEYYFYTYLTIK